MTPLSNCRMEREELYQARHTRSRFVVERCNGLLKGRFQALLNILEYSPERACDIIRSCRSILLHSVAIESNIQFDPSEYANMEVNEHAYLDGNVNGQGQTSV